MDSNDSLAEATTGSSSSTTRIRKKKKVVLKDKIKNPAPIPDLAYSHGWGFD
jgi:hypothetical protein